MSNSENASLINVIPRSLDNAVDNLATPISKSVGESLQDIWFLILGGPLHQAALKRETKYAIEAEKFKAEILEKISNIPEERLVEPDFQTASLAFENSKYCLESEDLRKLFSNLISATVDKDKAGQAHPVFSEIIKRMSPQDASNLESFGNVKGYAIAKYRHWIGNTGYTDIFENVFLQNKKYENELQAQSISINVLCSLGLASVSYEKKFAIDSYADFYKTDIYIGFNKMCQQHNSTQYPKPSYTAEILERVSKERLDKAHESLCQPQRIEIICGMIELTDLGSAFKRICLGE